MPELSKTSRSGLRSLAVIPARGGSKRIDRKNLRLMSGQPLISWAIRNALESDVFDQVVVSTDDLEIADVSRSYGASVPFLRAQRLADDHASTMSVVIDAIERLAASGQEFDVVCCLYPASIFATADDIARSRDQLLDQKSADYVVTVARFDTPIERALDLSESGTITPVSAQHMATRTQDLPVRYRDVGQFYWGTTEAWLAERSVFDNSIGYVLNSARVQDIDTEEDWDLAQLLHTLELHQPEGQRARG